MNDDMPPVAAIKSQTIRREEAEAILQHIALEAAQGASQINVACIAFNQVMLMSDVGLDREPLRTHFEALSAARDAMIQAVVQFREALDEMELDQQP